MTKAASGDSKSTLYCSFCFESQHHTKMLISGPAGIFICDECATLAAQHFADSFGTATESPET